MNRDCKNCIRSKGVTEYDNGCTAWDCDFIPRKEAIKLWESIVHCKDCKHYDMGKWIFKNKARHDERRNDMGAYMPKKCQQCKNLEQCCSEDWRECHFEPNGERRADETQP